jgi:copper chaperone NosL
MTILADIPINKKSRLRGSLHAVAIGVAVSAIVAGFTALIHHAQSLPNSVTPVIWDKESCAECKMAIGDPSFAAQLQSKDGRVLDFDDPGCLITYMIDRRPEIHAVYFHLYRENEWLDRDRTGFVSGVRSPMGFDLAATRKESPGAISWERAIEAVRERNDRRSAGDRGRIDVSTGKNSIGK